MQISTTYSSEKTPNILKVASKDKTRPILQHVHLDVDRAVVEATDSYCLAAVPVDVEPGDVSGMIPAEAFAAFLKTQRGNKYLRLSLQCDAETVTLETPDGVQSWKRPEGQYPNVPQLVPDESVRSGFRVKLDARKLLQVAEAIGSDAITLSFVIEREREEGDGIGYFPSNLQPIIVHNGGHGETALVMPIRMPA